MNCRTYFHGSTSASFPGVFKTNKPALKSVGALLEEGIAPYTGEQSANLSKNGVNWKYISAVPYFNLRYAVDYALRYAKEGWNLECCKRNIRGYQREIRGLKYYGKKWLKENGNFYISQLEAAIFIEKLRIKNWENLTKTEKRLITKPFAVIYGIKYYGKVANPFTQCDDIGIPSPILLYHLTLYVPENKLKFSKKFTSNLEYKIQIFPFEELEYLSKISMDNEDSINELLGKPYIPPCMRPKHKLL